MRTSHASSNINPRTPNHRTTESHSRTNGKTSRNHQNDPRMQIEILLPWLGKEDQTMGNAMRRLHQTQKNQQQPYPTENDQQYRTRIGTRRLTRNRHTAKPTAGYQNIVIMIDVFSRYLFAYPTQNATAKTIGRCIVDVMTRHAYLPTLILSPSPSVS